MKLVCVIYCVPEWTDDLKLGIAMSRYEYNSGGAKVSPFSNGSVCGNDRN